MISRFCWRRFRRFSRGRERPELFTAASFCGLCLTSPYLFWFMTASQKQPARRPSPACRSTRVFQVPDEHLYDLGYASLSLDELTEIEKNQKPGTKNESRYGKYSHDVIKSVREAGYPWSDDAGMSESGRFSRGRFDIWLTDSFFMFFWMTGHWGNWGRTVRNRLLPMYDQ